MNIKKLFLTGLLTGAMAVSAFALDVKVGADLELDYVNFKVDKTATTDIKSANWKTSDIDIKVSAKIADNVDFFWRLDADDNSDQTEEINLTFKDVVEGLNIKVGKQEVAFGGDFDYTVVDPYTHNSTTGSFFSASHPGEVDNKYGITANYKISDILFYFDLVDEKKVNQFMEIIEWEKKKKLK